MTKVMKIGTVKCGQTNATMYVKAEIKDGRLSLTGVIGPLKNGNARGSCGQINMEFDHRNKVDNDQRYENPTKADEIKYAKGWNAETWLDLLDIWKRWHLNDMHAECEHQRILGWRYDTHQGQKCPVCGYEIGTKWIKEKLPQYVINRLKKFPVSDTTPAWC